MSKICTDLEQSRKLLSLRIDKNTADMHYFSDGYNPIKLDVGYSAENAKFYRGTENEYIPAWSLTALLELISLKNANGECSIPLYKDNYNGVSKWLFVGCDYEKGKDWIGDNPVDAAFEMVCWLLENGYIKKVKK